MDMLHNRNGKCVLLFCYKFLKIIKRCENFVVVNYD